MTEALVSFKQFLVIFNKIRNSGEYESELIEHKNKFDEEIKEKYNIGAKDFCSDNELCAHGTNGFALFLSFAVTGGKLLPKNGRKLAGLVTTTGEILTDNKHEKRQDGPSTEDICDENFVSAVSLNNEPERALNLALTYADKASSEFSDDSESFWNRLGKKFYKYLQVNKEDEDKVEKEFPKIDPEKIKTAYEKLSKIPVVAFGHGIGKNTTNLEELGANAVEVQYEQIDICYVVVPEKDIGFLRNLVNEIVDSDTQGQMSFISKEEVEYNAAKKGLSFAKSFMNLCDNSDLSNNSTGKRVVIEKELPCKWHRLNNGSDKNKLLSKKIKIEYLMPITTNLTATQPINGAPQTPTSNGTNSKGSQLVDANPATTTNTPQQTQPTSGGSQPITGSATPLPQTPKDMAALTQEQQQEILKGLLKSAIEKNTEEFKSQLEGAKNVGFDFFNTKLSEDYEFNDITVHKDTSLIQDVRIMKHRYPEELSKIFFKQEIITRDNVTYLYGNISTQSNLTISYNLNFIKLSLDYIKKENIQIDQRILKKICRAVIHTMNSISVRCGPNQYSEVQENILKIEEVVKSLVPLLEKSEKKKFEDNFYKRKNEIEANFNITTVTPPQTVTGSATPLPQTPIVNGTNNNLPTKNQDSQPLIGDDKKHNPQQNHFLGISPRGWIIIAAGAVVGALALYFLAPLILGATVAIDAQLGLMASGAVAGGVIGYFTDVVINKCYSEPVVQTA